MQKGNVNKPDHGKNSQPSAATNKDGLAVKIKDEKVTEAYKQAEHDIEEDPEFKDPGPTHDMDEGELARYEAQEKAVKK